MQTGDTNAHTDDLRFWEIVAIGAYVLGLAATGFYAFAGGGWRVFGVLTIVGTAAWLAGTALGFIFGVPRVRAGDPPAAGNEFHTFVVPNTNLEQISDWLTKIIVGATLVQLGPLSESIGRLAAIIGRSLGSPDRIIDGTVVGGGVLVMNFVAGFIWGYLWCSLRVFREMQSLVERERSVRVSEAQGS